MPRMNHVVKHWNGRPREESRCHCSRNQRKCEPLKDGVGQNHAGADNDRCRSQEHRTESSCACIDHRLGQGHSLADAELNEVDKDNRVAHDDACAGDEADHRGRREECAQNGMGRHDADEG